MRAITVDVPFGLTVVLRTRVSGRLSITQYHSREEAESSGVDSAEPIIQSSVQEPPLDSHEFRVEVVPGQPEDISTQTDSVARNGIERPDSRLSQRTEPAYNEVYDFEEWVPYYQEQGIKIRDFAYENSAMEQRAPEIFNPYNALFKYERMVKLDAKEVLHLYDMGWLTEKQAESRLSSADWPSITDTDKRPTEYPWKPLNVKKPTGNPDEVLKYLARHLSSKGDPENKPDEGPVDAVEYSPGTNKPPSTYQGASSNRLYAPVATKRSRDFDGPDVGAEDEAQQRHKRQRVLTKDNSLHPPLPQGHTSSSVHYPTPSQSPSPFPNVIQPPTSSLTGGNATTQTRSRALTRTETLWDI